MLSPTGWKPHPTNELGVSRDYLETLTDACRCTAREDPRDGSDGRPLVPSF